MCIRDSHRYARGHVRQTDKLIAILRSLYRGGIKIIVRLEVNYSGPQVRIHDECRFQMALECFASKRKTVHLNHNMRYVLLLAVTSRLNVGEESSVFEARCSRMCDPSLPTLLRACLLLTRPTVPRPRGRCCTGIIQEL